MTTHHAPSVVFPLGRSRLLASVLLTFWGAGLALTLLWFSVAQVFDWRFSLAFALVLLAGLSALRGWKNSPSGQLAWDGECWHWESVSYQSGVAEQTVSVVADFQRVILVRTENQAHASMWLLLEQRAMPERWMDLRRALYSPRRTTASASGADFSAAADT